MVGVIIFDLPESSCLSVNASFFNAEPMLPDLPSDVFFDYHLKSARPFPSCVIPPTLLKSLFVS
jgi:hypothetical protein